MEQGAETGPERARGRSRDGRPEDAEQRVDAAEVAEARVSSLGIINQIVFRSPLNSLFFCRLSQFSTMAPGRQPANAGMPSPPRFAPPVERALKPKNNSGESGDKYLLKSFNQILQYFQDPFRPSWTCGVTCRTGGAATRRLPSSTSTPTDSQQRYTQKRQLCLHWLHFNFNPKFSIDDVDDAAEELPLVRVLVRRGRERRRLGAHRGRLDGTPVGRGGTGERDVNDMYRPIHPVVT